MKKSVRNAALSAALAARTRFPTGRPGIAVRAALLSWLVATASLLFFILGLLPQQKAALLDNLRSQAHGVSIALRSPAANGFLSGDYRAIVEHCREILAGDPAVDYIVVSRQDGFSLIHDRAGWRTETLPDRWHPADGLATEGIELVSLFNRRVFAYSQAFDYSRKDPGWIHVGLSLNSYDRNLRALYLRTALLAVVCLAFAFGASVGYARLLVRPILALQDVVQRVAGGDLAARASVKRGDELGRLAFAVNTMADTLLRRDRFLKEVNETLEQRVRERTHELEAQASARERVHHELAEAQRRLMQLSREAGMAEVATGVLHNVGNVLNSVNVSAVLLRDSIRTSELPQLARAVALLEQHHEDLPHFLTADPRGRLVVPFLRQLCTQLETERAELSAETVALSQNIEHIKEIVAMQQTFARAAAVLEQINPLELAEHALAIHGPSLARHECVMQRLFAAGLPPITTDRHNVVQILTNFIANAVHATKPNPPGGREITVVVEREGPAHLAFRVTDNGLGIAEENLPRIFSLGFTTRKDGHGFGLHAGALAARALGGRLTVASPGPGLGATFSLILPVSPALPQPASSS